MIQLEGGGCSCSRSSPWRRSTRPGAPERAGRQQGPPWPRWRAAGAVAPDPLHCPGFPLPEAAAILPMMERSTLILAPAAAGGGDPRGQEPRRGPGHSRSQTKDPGPGQSREAAGPTVAPLEGGGCSCSRSAPLSWLPAAGGGDPRGQEPRRGPRTEPEPGKGPRAQARAGRQQGPLWGHRGPTRGRRVHPDPLPLPWLPAAGGGGDPRHDGAEHLHPGPRPLPVAAILAARSPGEGPEPSRSQGGTQGPPWSCWRAAAGPCIICLNPIAPAQHQNGRNHAPRDCSQRYTLANSGKTPVFLFAKVIKTFCGYIRKLLDIYEQIR